MIIYTCPKCGGDLVDYVITTYPPIAGRKCLRCDYRWESEREIVVRVPFEGEELGEEK